MTYLFLILVILFLTVMSYRLFSKDFLSPSFLLCISFLFGVVCSFFGRLSWNPIEELHLETLSIIIIGLFCFIVGEIIVRLFVKIKLKKIGEQKKINIEFWKIIISFLFVTITMVLYFFEIRRIVFQLGHNTNNISQILKLYRETTSLYTTKYVGTDLSINVIVSQMRKACDMLCYLYMFFLVNNVTCQSWKESFLKGNRKFNIGYILIILVCAISSFLTGGRMKIMSYIIGFVFLYLCLRTRNSEMKINKKKIIKYFMLSSLPLLLFFYISSAIVGRKKDVSPSSYVSFYFGSAITGLDKYVEDPAKKNGRFGEETLSGIYTTLYKFHLIDETDPISLRWYPYQIQDTVIHANIFTSFRRYYHDFGTTGLVLCQILFGMIMVYLYYKSTSSKNVLYIIFYSSIVYILLDHVRDDIFFRNIVHFNTIINLILLSIEYYLLVHFSFKDLRNFKLKIKR